MSINFPRSVTTVAGQQIYAVPGNADVIPSAVTVNGAAATFSSAPEVDTGRLLVTILTPTIAASGLPVVFSYAQKDTTIGISVPVTMGDGIDSGMLTISGASTGVLWSSPVDSYSSLTVSVSTLQSGLSMIVEVTNDTDGSTGWRTARGFRGGSGIVLTSGITSVLDNYTFNVAGFKFARLRVAAATSGTTTCFARLGSAEVQPDVNTVSTTTINSVSTSGGLAPADTSRLPSSAASINATVLKASSGRIYKILGANVSATIKYLKLYNKATAPVPASDTPALTIALLPNQLVNIDFMDIGFYCSAGISWCVTALPADTDTTAVAAGDIVGLNIICA